MKLDNIIEKSLGRNRAKTLDKAQRTIRFVLESNGDALRIHAGSDFCLAIKKVMKILDHLSERKISKDNIGYASFSEFYRGMITKGYEYLTDNPETIYIEKAIFNIGTPRLLELKKELGGEALKMRKAVNELSESFEDHMLCIEKIKIQIEVEKIREREKTENDKYSWA
jgi:hypothetical protein